MFTLFTFSKKLFVESLPIRIPEKLSHSRDIKSRLDRIFVKLAVELSIFISSSRIHQHERIRIISPWTWSTRRAFSIRERESFKLAWGRSFLITRRRRAGWGGWVAARVPVCRRFVLPPLSRGRHCSRDSIGSQCRGPPRIVFFANLVRERERELLPPPPPAPPRHDYVHFPRDYDASSLEEPSFRGLPSSPFVPSRHQPLTNFRANGGAQGVWRGRTIAFLP